MILELSDVYIPKELLHREKQLKVIRDVFSNFRKNECGTNLAILGVTGSGKTTIIKKVIEEENNSIYISGADTNTPLKTIKSICKINAQNYSDVLKITIEKLLENPKILIIDEIDKIKNLKELFNHLNTIYRRTMIPIIIISLRRDIISNMPVDARKTLFFERLNLPSYNSVELKDILDSRLKQMKETKLEEGTKNYISAIAGRQGSARILIYLTLKCIQKQNFSQGFIDEMYKEMMHQDWFDFVNDINETEKEFLKILIGICNPDKETTSEILGKEMKYYSQARISQLLNTFEKYSVIETHHKNLGRGGGRKRIIKFTSKEIYDELNKRF